MAKITYIFQKISTILRFYENRPYVSASYNSHCKCNE